VTSAQPTPAPRAYGWSGEVIQHELWGFPRIDLVTGASGGPTEESGCWSEVGIGWRRVFPRHRRLASVEPGDRAG